MGGRLLNNFSICYSSLLKGFLSFFKFLSLLQLVSIFYFSYLPFVRNNFWLHFILSLWLLLPLGLIFYLSFLSSLNLEIFSIFLLISAYSQIILFLFLSSALTWDNLYLFLYSAFRYLGFSNVFSFPLLFNILSFSFLLAQQGKDP